MTTSSNSDLAAELQTIRRYARRYDALDSASGSVVWVVDPQMRPTGRNEAWERYTGQSAAEYAELGWIAAIHPDDRARLHDAAAHAIATVEPFTIELRIRRSDGLFRRNVIRGIPVREGDTVVEWIGTATDIEDARRAADDLAAMEERLRIAHAAAGVGTWEWQFDTNQVRWSTEVLQLLGLDEAVTPKLELWLERVHAEDRAAVTERWAQALAAGATHFTDTFRMIHADGAIRWILTSAVIFRLPSGDPVRAVGLNMDVTAQRTLQEQMEAALAEQRDLRARLLALTDGAEPLLASRDEAAARAGVLELARRVLPADGYAIWWLEAERHEWQIVASAGLSAEYMRQRLSGDPIGFVQPVGIDDVSESQMFEGRRQAHAAEGIVSLLTVPLPIRGERRASLVTYHRRRHVATETERRVGMALGQIAAAALGNAELNAAQDRAQERAERQAVRMAYLADASAVLSTLDYESTLRQIAHMAVARLADWCVVYLVRDDGTIARVVTAHADPEKAELLRLLEERDPGDPEAPGVIQEVIKTGTPAFYPFLTDEVLIAAAQDAEHLEILRRLGLHSVLIAPLSARGRTLGTIDFGSTHAERGLSHDDVTVLTEVARRAALAIDNARLYREAELANRAKDEFLALLSHELRTPLNAIMGWSHMLRQGLPEPMQAHAFDVISRNAQSQKKLVEDLLDVARIASGRLDLDRAIVDLREIANAAIDSALPSARTKDIALSFAANPEAVRLYADPHRLLQVAANLLSNAIKFTDGGGEVRVTIARAHGQAELRVTDNGIGIAPEFLPYAFDRFRQADTSLTRNYAGLGLGLWVVKQITEAHGGHVRAESEGHGRGTTITVSLPTI